MTGFKPFANSEGSQPRKAAPTPIIGATHSAVLPPYEWRDKTKDAFVPPKP